MIVDHRDIRLLSTASTVTWRGLWGAYAEGSLVVVDSTSTTFPHRVRPALRLPMLNRRSWRVLRALASRHPMYRDILTSLASGQPTQEAIEVAWLVVEGRAVHMRHDLRDPITRYQHFRPAQDRPSRSARPRPPRRTGRHYATAYRNNQKPQAWRQNLEE